MQVEWYLYANITLSVVLIVGLIGGFYATNLHFVKNQREINEKFNISHMETISILKQSRSEMRKFQAEMQAFKDEMRELRRDSQIYLRMIFERVDRDKA